MAISYKQPQTLARLSSAAKALGFVDAISTATGRSAEGFLAPNGGSGTRTAIVTPTGTAKQFSSGSDFYTTGGKTDPTSGYAWVYYGYISAVPGSYSGIIAQTPDVGVNQGYGWQRDAGADSLKIYHAGSGVTLGALNALLDSIPRLWVGGWDGATVYLYRDGVLVYSVAMPYAPAFTAGTGQIKLLSSRDNNTSSGVVSMAAFANGKSVVDIAAFLGNNPWKLFGRSSANYLWVAAAGGAQNLAATATAQATATADLSKGVSLAAAALSVATSTAGMSLSVPLAATATGQASSTGQISLTVTFAANALASALATAGITLDKPLAAAAAGQATGTAALGGAANLAANATAQATGSATLSLAINLSAAAVAQATATADFGGSATLAAAAIANAQATAALAVGKPLAATAQAQASAGATLWLDVPLNAAALAQAAAAGSLSLTVNLAAAAVASATASASLPSDVRLSASGAAVATSTATLTVMGSMDSSINRPFVIRQTHRSWSKKQTARSWLAAQTSRY